MGREGRGRSTCLPPRFDNPGYGPGAGIEAPKEGRSAVVCSGFSLWPFSVNWIINTA